MAYDIHLNSQQEGKKTKQNKKLGTHRGSQIERRRVICLRNYGITFVMNRKRYPVWGKLLNLPTRGKGGVGRSKRQT